MDLLEATGDQQVIHLLKPDTENGIFVKNLENVQGDERDVILFSTAFSKRPGDQNMPLNFGPLTRFGGEKRLNVAVTRARAKVIVFTSFDPSDIDLSRTRSIGMAHLKAYLEAAAAASGHGGVASVASDRGQPEKIQETIASALQARDSKWHSIMDCLSSSSISLCVIRSRRAGKWRSCWTALDGRDVPQSPTANSHRAYWTR